jgi:hypothetical protein
MTLPGSPTGRDLVAFADELRATANQLCPAAKARIGTEAVMGPCELVYSFAQGAASSLLDAVLYIDQMADAAFAKEAREALRPEAEEPTGLYADALPTLDDSTVVTFIQVEGELDAEGVEAVRAFAKRWLRRGELTDPWEPRKRANRV